ncbi:MAG: tetratricopeptide repeat protein [Propionivibrio sp.]
MSLLMDALKKAEEAKRAACESRSVEASTARELQLTPLETAKTEPTSGAAPRQPSAAAISPLPELALHIDSVDADLAAVSKENASKRNAQNPGTTPPNSAAARKPDSTPTDSERAAARNVFSAKQTGERRSALWFILPIASVVAAGIGAYFWWQLQAVSGRSLSIGTPTAANAIAQDNPAQSPAMPPHATPPVERPVQAPVAANAAPLVETVQPSPEPAPTAKPAKRDAAAMSSETHATKGDRSPVQTARQEKPAQIPAAASAPESGGQFRLTRSQPAPNLTLEQAYDALQAGHLDVAQRAYQHVLRGDPKNTDALLGLATAAARQGDTGRAHSYYLLALEANPNDPTAQAGVIQTRGQSDPVQSESRLKTALANQPDSPALLFALGNLYASEQRWSEAQQAYFRAYATEPDNADFIFNLAVSLDQLHQDKLAAQYYQMALNAAETPNGSRAVGFDRGQVQKRIQDLQP